MNDPHPFRLARALSALALLLAVSALPAASQAPRPRSVRVAGVVVDSASGKPVGGARVDMGRAGMALTDARGRFALGHVAAGTQALMVRALGYEGAVAEVQVAPTMEPVRIAVSPNPVMLQAITVQADRLRARRNAAPVSVRVLDQSAFAAAAGLNARDFILERSTLSGAPCTSTYGVSRRYGSDRCVWMRGSATAAAVYIDEHPAIAGLDELAVYQPDEIYMAEIYDGGRQIRVYTKWFIQRAARGHLNPEPFVF
jgi:hypothetical protein